MQQPNQVQNKTETGIDFSRYVEEKAAGTIALRAGAPASGNYILIRTSFGVAIENGKPVIKEGEPQLKNINRGSLAEMREVLSQQEALIVAYRAQLAAIEADMDALDKIK